MESLTAGRGNDLYARRVVSGKIHRKTFPDHVRTQGQRESILRAGETRPEITRIFLQRCVETSPGLYRGNEGWI